MGGHICWALACILLWALPCTPQIFSPQVTPPGAKPASPPTAAPAAPAAAPQQPSAFRVTVNGTSNDTAILQQWRSSLTNLDQAAAANNLSAWSGASVCGWGGITCGNGTQRVTDIALVGLNLQGDAAANPPTAERPLCLRLTWPLPGRAHCYGAAGPLEAPALCRSGRTLASTELGAALHVRDCSLLLPSVGAV